MFASEKIIRFSASKNGPVTRVNGQKQHQSLQNTNDLCFVENLNHDPRSSVILIFFVCIKVDETHKNLTIHFGHRFQILN
jgi:hypothetical protein